VDAAQVVGEVRAGALEALGFTPLGILRFGAAGPHTAGAVALYVAPYGDAVGLAEPLDPRVRLRLVSILGSGVLVETRVRAPTEAAPPSMPDASPDAAAAETAAGVLDALATRPLPWLDRQLAALEDDRLALRYPSHRGAGVIRQLLDVSDPDSVWIAHRGLVRRLQAEGDGPIDHRDLDLALAALRRGQTTRARGARSAPRPAGGGGRHDRAERAPRPSGGRVRRSRAHGVGEPPRHGRVRRGVARFP
jgi:hypothetical protein